MKIIAVTTAEEPFQTRLYADSALGRDVMPLFIPDAASGWYATPAVAARIGRLGKNIAPEFAARYIDAWSVVLVMDTDSPEGCDTAFIDSAVTAGRWIPAAEVGNDLTVAADATNVTPTEAHVAFESFEINNIINHISRLATLKTGDIVILPATIPATPLIAGMRIRCSLNSVECLNVKVK